MLLRKVTLVILFISLLVLSACDSDDEPQATPEPTDAPSPTGTIIIGKMGDDPIEEIEEYQPLADYLAANLGEYGIGVGEVKVAIDLETMVGFMQAGEVDLFIDSAWAALSVVDQAEGQVLIRREKTGRQEKHAIFFVLADSGIESLDDLPGHIVAFESSDSTSGYMLPWSMLVENGLTTAGGDGLEAETVEDAIVYVFSEDDDNTLEWVRDGRVTAGAVDNDAYEEYVEENPDIFVILAETQPISRDQYVITGGGMDDDLADELASLMTGIDELEQAEDIFPPKTAKFDEFSGDSQTELDTMQRLYALVTGATE